MQLVRLVALFAVASSLCAAVEAARCLTCVRNRLAPWFGRRVQPVGLLEEFLVKNAQSDKLRHNIEAARAHLASPPPATGENALERFESGDFKRLLAALAALKLLDAGHAEPGECSLGNINNLKLLLEAWRSARRRQTLARVGGLLNEYETSIKWACLAQWAREWRRVWSRELQQSSLARRLAPFDGPNSEWSVLPASAGVALQQLDGAIRRRAQLAPHSKVAPRGKRDQLRASWLLELEVMMRETYFEINRKLLGPWLSEAEALELLDGLLGTCAELASWKQARDLLEPMGALLALDGGADESIGTYGAQVELWSSQFTWTARLVSCQQLLATDRREVAAKLAKKTSEIAVGPQLLSYL